MWLPRPSAREVSFLPFIQGPSDVGVIPSCQDWFVESGRKCPRCGRSSKTAEFGWRDSSHTRPQSFCKDCTRIAWRLWYGDEKNKSKHLAQLSRRRQRRIQRNQQILAELKNRPCADCGRLFPTYVMDFDHVGEKTGEVSSFVYTSSTERLLDEASKCDVVCANCHRERTYQRLTQQRHESGEQGRGLSRSE